MRVLSVVGARPQFIKAAMVSRVIRSVGQEILLHTGQHYDANMSQVFFEELELPPPDIHLGIGSGSHAEQTGRMLIGIEQIIQQEQPDWVLVYGDTNSTIAGALAAVKLMVPVAHVEAGLRSWNRSMPEEINRVVCDTISSLLFCPTHQSMDNLAREGIQQGVHLVGDVMGDSLLHHLALARQNSHILSTHGLEPGKYALVTVHRAGNTDDPQKLAALLAALGNLPGQVVFPVHPRTARSIKEHGLKLAGRIKTIDPVGYLDMLQLEANADCILTDSGGVQKEAYWLGVRCITLRDETEWVETVEAGWNQLTGSDPDAILKAVLHWHPTGERDPVYGDGHAAERIVSLLAGKQSPGQEIFSSSPFPGEHKL